MINPTIQVVVGPITPLVTSEVEVAQESFSPRQTVLPQENVTDAARPCTHIYRTTGKVIRTERDSATPRDASSSERRSRSSFLSPKFVAISVSPAQFRDQDIVNTRHPGSIVKRDRSVERFDARINGNSAKYSDYATFFSHVVYLEVVSREVADVNASKRMSFASITVLDETPKFVDLWLSTVNTVDKLNSAFAPATRAKGWIDHSDWLTSRHRIAEDTADKATEAKVYSDYIKISEFETMNVFERENNSGIRLTENNSGTRLTENIPLTRLNENIPLKRQMENIPLTR